MSASRFFQTLQDPYGFTEAFRDLGLTPEDLPGITRESRLEGSGR